MFLDESLDLPRHHKTASCPYNDGSYWERHEPDLLNKDFNIMVDTSNSHHDLNKCFCA